MTIDRFATKASTYEQNPNRVDNVANIADGIVNAVQLDKSMHLIDFGAGTGLLLERIAPHVGKITAVDVSSSMIAQLEAKREKLGCELGIAQTDLETSDLSGEFDGIISSMTMHHIRNIDAMFGKFHALVKKGGFIAISDLDSEDGSFHTEDAGVFHNGFDRDEFAKAAMATGFEKVQVSPVSVVSKPHRDFSVFLLTAIR